MLEHPNLKPLTPLYQGLLRHVAEAVTLQERLIKAAGGPFPSVMRFFYEYHPVSPIHDSYRTDMLKHASEEDRSDPLFTTVTAPYWVESLADHLRPQYRLRVEEIEGLRRIHAEHEGDVGKVASQFDESRYRAALVGAFGLLATMLPKEAIGYLGGDSAWYGGYRLALFGILLFVLAWFLLFQRLDRASQDEQRAARVTGLVLLLWTYRGADVDPVRGGGFGW